MTNGQKWTTIILAFLLLLIVAIGGYAYNSVLALERVLSAPASVSKVDIDADVMWEVSQNGELQLKDIRLNRIRGEFSSRLLDLLLLQGGIKNEHTR